MKTPCAKFASAAGRTARRLRSAQTSTACARAVEVEQKRDLEDYTLVGNTALERVFEIEEIPERHGLILSGLRRFEREVTAETSWVCRSVPTRAVLPPDETRIRLAPTMLEQHYKGVQNAPDRPVQPTQKVLLHYNRGKFS